MSVGAVTLLFFLLTIGLFVLPFVPALRELYHRADARALAVSADGRVSPSYFADRFRQVLTERLAGPVDHVRSTDQTLVGQIDGGEPFVVLPASHRTITPEEDGSVDALVLTVGDLEVPDGAALLREVYVSGALRGGDQVLLRATLTEGGLELGDEATSLRWLHSEADLHLGRRARLYGRVSAAGTLRLGEGSAFERLHGARVEFGEPGVRPDGNATSRERRRVDLEALGERAESAGGRTRVSGDLALDPDSDYDGDLVVTGDLHLGARCRIAGSVKARHLRCEKEVEIGGALVASGDLRLGRDCQVHGPLLAEGELRLAAGTTVGASDVPCTVRARRIEVAPGCVVHGTVWTQGDGGEVLT